MSTLRSLVRSFRFAGRGIAAGFMRERNLRIHGCAAVFVVLAGIWQKLSAAAWAVELLCCALVIALELVNTALEAACDALHPARSPSIALAKDAAASAVLIAACASVVIWLIILLQEPFNEQNLREAFRQQIWPRWALLAWAAVSATAVCVLPYSKTKEEPNDD